MAGWVKLHRALQDWEWWHDDNMLRVFLTILLNVNHIPGKWKGHDVEIGQWITGRNKLSEMTGVSNQSIRTVLKRLENSNEITVKSTNQFSIITVINWYTYQSDKKEVTNQQQTTNKQVTTNKNEKNKDSICRVIDYLNRKTGKSYRSATEATAKLINARLKEGFTPENFKSVIDNQCRVWIGTDQEQYLRPATLFSASKFDSYLQNTENKPTVGAYY